jgi:lysozyme
MRKILVLLILFVIFQFNSGAQIKNDNIIEVIDTISVCDTIHNEIGFEDDSIFCYQRIEKHYYYKNSMLSVDSTLISYAYDTAFYNQLQKDVHGLDMSKWQGYVDWKLIPKQYQFVFIKATQGLSTDPNFHKNWNNCTITKGAYHFFNPAINGVTQAKYFLSVVHMKAGDLPPVIDVEYIRPWRRINRYTAAKNLKLMLDYIEKEIGVRPIIYSNCSFWNRYVYKYFKGDCGRYPLWVANYCKEDPCIPMGWKTWTFWQYSDKGRISGHPTYWDLNYYNGNDLKDIIIK